MMKLVPMNTKVLLRMKNEDKVTKGGIIIPDQTTAERYRKATVEAIGNKVKELQVGNQVVVCRFRADEYMMDGQLYQVTEEKEILFVYDGEEPTISEVNEVA